MKRPTSSFEKSPTRPRDYKQLTGSKCYSLCAKFQVECPNKECRLWIDYPDDLNCTAVAVVKNNKMILQEVGKRLNLTPSRIKQIESAALKKMKIRGKSTLNILE